VFWLTPTTAARSRAGGIRSPGLTFPFCNLAPQLGGHMQIDRVRIVNTRAHSQMILIWLVSQHGSHLATEAPR